MKSQKATPFLRCLYLGFLPLLRLLQLCVILPVSVVKTITKTQGVIQNFEVVFEMSIVLQFSL